MARTSSSIPRVALLIETTRSYTRDMLAGVRRYVAEHGPWSIFIELRALDSSPPPWLADWDGDGIICRTFTSEMAAAVKKCGIPAVEVRSSYLCPELPFVGMDNSLVGKSVADHFLKRGYRNFAAYSLDTERFFEQRVQNFVSVIREAGCECTVLPESEAETVSDWERSQDRLIKWLESLPKPVGVFAANDQLGVRVLDACQRAGLAVPEEVAVVGTENEETLCALANPPLTSLKLDGLQVGYLAAEVLDGLMHQRATKRREWLIPPKGIMVRASSDDLVIHDKLVQKAARLIRERVAQGINVASICDELHISRSSLERRMKASLGRTPKEEIQRMQFRLVERLLLETDLTVEAIAAQCGFTHSHYLHAAFKSRHGMTPGDFRKSMEGS
ncbi:MAG: DNA-binding transcriptional regulator [Verrucomicrobiaceae bacterium]|nr:DNA-binding transcriptional regulator [Verrucomicrobiaceae bacterium]